MSDSPEVVLQNLFDSVQTLQLASITPEGLPNISYAPYVQDDDGHFYIFISQLAAHTQDLLGNPSVAAMLVEDEQTTRQMFARTRLVYHCKVEQVPNVESAYNENLDRLEEKFGNIIELLRTLPDFILFRLVPESGRFVKGFGQAYELTGTNLKTLKHIA